MVSAIIAMRFIKEMYDLNIPGPMNFFDLLIIEEWANLVPENGVVVEVGSHLGRSSYSWAKSIPSSATLYCVDIWDEIYEMNLAGESQPINRYEIFLENVNSCKNIIPIKGKAPNINYPGNPIDIFYIDASHYNPSDLQIIMHFKKFLKPNAKICGHDYSNLFPDVKTNVKILEHMYKTKVKRFKGSSQWEIQT